MRKTHLLLGLALLAAAPAAALAQPTPGAAGHGGRGPGALFDRIDANHDGRVTWDESWAFVQARFTAADRDGNGGLTIEELQEGMRSATPRRQAAADNTAGPGAARAARSAEHMDALFRMLDADRNGQVTLIEIRPMAEARFRAVDANLDSVVDRSEMPQRPDHHRPGRGGPGASTAPG